MTRLSLGLVTATFASLLAIEHAAAGGCSFSWRPFGSCGNAYSYAQPYYAAQPQVVQVTPAPIIVQVAQPQVIVQQVAAPEPVRMYVVNQGPHYSGPNLTDYSNPLYYAPKPIRPYPYVSGGYHRWHGYHRHGYHRYGYHRTGYHKPYRAYPVRRYY